MSRRAEMLERALGAFAERGYDGTSIADLAAETGLSKAAYSYHFAGKDEILVELADPLLSDLESLAEDRPVPQSAEELEELLDAYVEVLLAYRMVAVWVDGDKSVLNHPTVGERMAGNNRRMRALIAGADASRRDLVRASAVLGAIWRPIRNLTDIDVAGYKREVIATAMHGFAAEDERQ
jgi:AcrR family transcriptional regulator